MTTPMTTPAPKSLAELEAALGPLALDAEEGVPGAAVELATVEAALAAARRGLERIALATEERRARAATASAAAEAARVAEVRARMVALLAESRAAAEAVDVALTHAATEIQRFRRLRREVYAAEATIRTPARRWLASDALRGSVLWRLGDVLPGLDRPHRAFWQPLAVLLAGELLAAEDGAGNPAAPVEAAPRR
jgi:hypothetical protein